MAKPKSRAEYESSLSSIFDFIFKNANAKSKPLKPVRPTGLKPSDELVGGLAEVAAMPGFFASNSILGVFDEALNQSLIEYQTDSIDSGGKNPYFDKNAGRVRVKAWEATGFVTNPMKFIDNAFKKAKAERQWTRMTGAGRVLDSALAGYWAHRNGMSKDVLKIAAAAGVATAVSMDIESERMIAENSVLRNISNDPRSGVNPTLAKDIYKHVFSTGVHSEQGLKKFLDSKVSSGSVNPAVRDKILDEYRKSVSDARTFRVDGTLSGTGYRKIYGENLLHRAEIAETPEEKHRLKRAHAMVGLMSRLKNNDRGVNLGEVSKNLRSTIDEFELRKGTADWSGIDDDLLKSLKDGESKLLMLSQKAEKEDRRGNFFRFGGASDGSLVSEGDYRRSKAALEVFIGAEISKKLGEMGKLEREILKGGLSSDALAAKIEEMNGLSREIDISRTQLDTLSTLPARDWRLSFASSTQAYRYVKDYVGTGAFIQGLLTGNTYVQERSGWGAPGRERKIKVIGKHFGKDTEFEFAFIIPRNEINPLYNKLTNLYYLTPGSIAKTLLFNGEGFMYLEWRHQQKVLEKIRGVDLSSLKSKIPEKLWEKFFTEDGILKEDVISSNFEEFVTLIGSAGLGDVSKLAASAISKSKVLRKLSWVFSSGKRWVTNLKLYKFLFDKEKGFRAQLRQKFFGWLSSKIKDGALKEFVGLFAAGKIAFRQLIKEGVKAFLASTASFFTTPIGGAIVWVLSEGLVLLGDALLKPILKITVTAIFTIVAISILFMVWVSGTGQESLTSQFHHITPGPCEECIAQNPHAGLYPDPPAETGGNYPPTDSTCPLGPGAHRCSQGFGPTASPYHQKKKAIDIATGSGVWYAPSDGHVISYEPENLCEGTQLDYGGEIVFVDNEGNNYMIMHAQALASVGSTLSKGDAVAVVQTGLVPDFTNKSCWTGAHFHLHVSSAGVNQDSLDWYSNKLNCNIYGC